jgi:hypothetical protein
MHVEKSRQQNLMVFQEAGAEMERLPQDCDGREFREEVLTWWKKRNGFDRDHQPARQCPHVKSA